MTSLARKVARTSVVHGCMNPVGPKQIHLRELLANVNISEWTKPNVSRLLLVLYLFGNEPPHDKTNKVTVRQRRLRSAWASAQSDQSRRCPHEESLGP